MSESGDLRRDDDHLWTVQDCADYLRRSTWWVYKRSSSGELPRARGAVGGVRFVPDQIRAWARGDAR